MAGHASVRARPDELTDGAQHPPGVGPRHPGGRHVGEVHDADSLGGALTTKLLRRGWVLWTRGEQGRGHQQEGFEALTSRLGVDPAALPRPHGSSAAA